MRVGGLLNKQRIMAAMEIDHEDEPNLTQFLDEELDYMEDYDYNIEDEQMAEDNSEGRCWTNCPNPIRRRSP